MSFCKIGPRVCWRCWWTNEKIKKTQICLEFLDTRIRNVANKMKCERRTKTDVPIVIYNSSNYTYKSALGYVLNMASSRKFFFIAGIYKFFALRVSVHCVLKNQMRCYVISISLVFPTMFVSPIWWIAKTSFRELWLASTIMITFVGLCAFLLLLFQFFIWIVRSFFWFAVSESIYFIKIKLCTLSISFSLSLFSFSCGYLNRNVKQNNNKINRMRL